MDNLRVPVADESGHEVKAMFQEFLRSYHYDGDLEVLTAQQKLQLNYMEQIESMVMNNKSTLYVNFAHLAEADPELAEAIEADFYRFEPYLRHALQELVAEGNQGYVIDLDKGQRELFVSFYNFPRVDRIRAMSTEKIGRLISISGTVTRSSEVRPELLFGFFICKKCGSQLPAVEQQFQYTEPQICKNPQCKTAGDFQLVVDKSAFVDWQRLRVQENADEIPPGSMPRCVDVICRNEVVEMAKAGDKVILTGAVAVVPDTSGLARVGETAVSGKVSGRGDSQFGDGVHGLRKLGCKEMTYKILFVCSSIQHTDQRAGLVVRDASVHSSFVIPTSDANADEAEMDLNQHLSEAEKADILRMHGEPKIYAKLVESLAPSVFGHLEVKRGVLLMLFGGVHKKTPEGINLRGDLNVCIVGDPSCAKSQFLKYVHGFLPRTVYTSGKSSSAAGLTASVVRDAETGEFCVEAGALMLADNGICCIDEFDKMDPHDQVAIHEAMEQQTISITKAGIQATLNARTSILAAANPVFGRYDRTKTLKANVAVSAAIMSRFDLFFVILDECNPVTDEQIARHIVGVHKEGGLEKASKDVPFTREQVQRYIRFARTINPVISAESRPVLVECYRLLRSNDLLGKNKTAYRITVRQLESLIRLAEALARVHLSEEVQPVYIKEAYRLLQKSIIFVETEDIELEDNEEEMDRLVNASREGLAASQSGGKRERDAEPNYEEEEQMLRDVGALGEGESYHGHLSSAAEESKTTSEAPVVAAAPKAPKKKKVTISDADFNDIKQLLKLKLRSHEEGQDILEYKGLQWKDLRNWYLAQFEAEHVSLEALEEKKKLVELVMKHLINKEGSIIVAGSTTTAEGEDEEPVAPEDRYLKWSPERA